VRKVGIITATRSMSRGSMRMPTKKAGTDSDGFTVQERAAMKERATELRAEGKTGAKRADGLRAVLDRIAEMAPADRALAERVHVTVTARPTPSCHPRRGTRCPHTRTPTARSSSSSRTRASSTTGTRPWASRTRRTSTTRLVGGVVRTPEVERLGGGEGRRAREERDLLTVTAAGRVGPQVPRRRKPPPQDHLSGPTMPQLLSAVSPPSHA